MLARDPAFGWPSGSAGVPSRPIVSILQTLAFFSIFDFAPTRLELKNFSLVAGWEEFCAALEKLSADGVILERDGLFSLAARPLDPNIRRDRYRAAVRKFSRADRAAVWLKKIPWVRFVAVTNSLAWWNTKPESDIDFFIVVRHGRLWTTRLLVAILLRIFRLRPGEGSLDPICCSFWMSDAGADLKEIEIVGDVYLSFWKRRLIVINNVGAAGCESWVCATSDRLIGCGTRVEHSAAPTFTKLIFKRTEKISRRLSMKLFPKNIRSASASGVVLTDYMIKLHAPDRRVEIRDRWRALCAEIGAPVEFTSPLESYEPDPS
ncbi:MAG: hypothetical protein HW383_670 [Candidatus Magasanikbacteria bacterium]|nr:hypothetical protein [Candidatus Magasanikbacteria bacterium]